MCLEIKTGGCPRVGVALVRWPWNSGCRQAGGKGASGWGLRADRGLEEASAGQAGDLLCRTAH